MFQCLKALSVPKNLKVIIACMFLRGEFAAWFEHAVQSRIYRWNKFKFSLEGNFRSFGADLERKWLKSLRIILMILVRVTLVDVRVHVPLML